MSDSANWSRLTIAACALMACLLTTGCAVDPGTLTPAGTRTLQFPYEITPSPITIDASVIVETTFTTTPEVRAIWKGWGINDQSMDAYLQTVAGALHGDIFHSGLFARVLTPGAGKPDYIVRIEAEELNPADLRLRMTTRLLDPATRKELFSRTAEVPLGIACGGPDKRNALTMLRPPSFPPDVAGPGWSGLHLLTGSLQMAVQQVMPVMKSGVGQHLKTGKEKSVEIQMQTAPLAELIIATDASTSLARARNRALITAKNGQLPALLREKKTDDLAALVVKIEQTILDLNHESEVAKDRAQQAMANNGNSTRVDELRGLTISYRERIELLKPILAALKDEIANRNR